MNISPGTVPALSEADLLILGARAFQGPRACLTRENSVQSTPTLRAAFTPTDNLE